MKTAETAAQKAGESLPPVEPKAAPATVAAAAPKVEAADRKGVDRFDGAYAGRMCLIRETYPDGSPRCWGLGLTVQHGKLSAAWQGKVGPARATGTISLEGVVDVSLAGISPTTGTPVPGTMTGSWARDTITVTGAWSNGAPVNATRTRAP